MAATEKWTVGRLLAWTTEFLKRHGADSPRLDAEVLLAESLGRRRIELYTSFEDEPSETVRGAFRELVRRRAGGEPVAYLVGRREFYSLAFLVTRDVLIPRPETELLVMRLVELAKGRPGPIAVCDVGTGSGIIAVTAAKHLPQARVTAVDTSGAALAVARKNAEAHGVSDRVEWVESDLFAAVAAQRRFDFIASNPPYVAQREWEALAPEVRRHEPPAALVAGPDGAEVIRRLIPQAVGRLHPRGLLLIEVSPMIHDAVLRLLADEAELEVGASIKDLARLPRVVQATKRG